MKKFFAVMAMVAGISGVFAGALATPASADEGDLVCITVTVFGNRVVPTTCIPSDIPG